MTPSLLERWLIAGCLERGSPFPAFLRRRLDRSATLRAYAGRIARTESSLGAARSAAEPVPPNLSVRIADALAASPTLPRRSPLPPWVVLSAALGAIALAALVATLRPDRPGPVGPIGVATTPRIPKNLQRSPAILLASAVEEPMSRQWRTLSTQTRRSVSEFIRALPGLPRSDREPKLN